MGNKTKIWLIIATSLVLIGGIIFSGVMAMFKWDFKKISTVKYETNIYEIDEKFSDISINSNTADIIFVPSDSEQSKVVCYEQKNAKHSVAVKNNTLTIEVDSTKKWYEHIEMNFGAPRINVYLPQAEYASLFIKGSTGDVEIPKEFKFAGIDITLSTGHVNNFASVSGKTKIKTGTGDIYINNISTGSLDLSVSTGKVTVSDVTSEGDVTIGVSTGKVFLTNVACKGITSSGNTGDMVLNNVIATEKFSIKRSTGDVKFENSDAAEIFIETDTGNVGGTLLTDKVFITQTDTGRVTVPKTANGGRCEITTNTGDIYFKVVK